MAEISFGDLLLYLTLTFIFVAFLYTLLNGFSETYIKPPKHFPPRGWRFTFKSLVLIYLMFEVRNGDFREALERGSSRLVRTNPSMIMTNKDKHLVFSVRTSLIGFLTIQMSRSSFDII